MPSVPFSSSPHQHLSIFCYFSSAFLWWLPILSIFSYSCWPCSCVLLRNDCFVHCSSLHCTIWQVACGSRWQNFRVSRRALLWTCLPACQVEKWWLCPLLFISGLLSSHTVRHPHFQGVDCFLAISTVCLGSLPVNSSKGWCLWLYIVPGGTGAETLCCRQPLNVYDVVNCPFVLLPSWSVRMLTSISCATPSNLAPCSLFSTKSSYTCKPSHTEFPSASLWLDVCTSQILWVDCV